MNKAVKLTFNGGMNQDLSRSKHPPNFYFEGRNIRIVTTDTQSTGSLTNEKGNSFLLEIPIVTINSNTRNIQYSVNGQDRLLPYIIENNGAKPRCELERQFNITNGNPIRTSGNQVIIGYGLIRDHFILISTDNLGFDCFWKLNEINYNLELIYLRDLNLNTNFPIQVISNFENEKIDKIYWVDSVHQLRFLNTEHSIENGDNENLIDLPATLLNQVGDYSFSQPEIIDKLSGGTHTAGMIQYAYNLYNVSSSQTALSPLSELVSLDKGVGNGGGAVNEVVGTIPVIKISDLDGNYSNIKIYAIKYTSFNELPQINLIVDSAITNQNEFTYYDDGNIIQSISLEEFTFLGSNVVIPEHIQSKDNRLFLANYKEQNFDIDLDFRAYSFNIGGSAIVANRFITVGSNNLVPNDTRVLSTPTPLYTSVPLEHSAININYNIYKYNLNGNLGGEGQYIKYNLIRSQLPVSDKHFKDDEIYRIGIEFYNNQGQFSLPKWIGDFKCWIDGTESNLRGYYSGLEITLKPAFYTWLNDNNNFLNESGVFDENLKPVGYKILRANRELKDRSILFQGLINPMISLALSDSNAGDNGVLEGPVHATNILEADEGLKMPSLIRRFDNYLCPMRATNNYAKLNPRGSYIHPNVKIFPPPINNNSNRSREAYKAADSDDWVSNIYQYNQMMQLYSPELIFNSISNVAATQLKVIGGIDNSTNSYWGQERNITTQEITTQGKTYDSISPHDVKAVGSNIVPLTGNISNLVDYGYIAGTARPDHPSDQSMVFNQLYREYLGTFNPRPNGASNYSFYGNPIVSEKGQGRTTYNNDSNFKFANSWEAIITDGGPVESDNGIRSIRSVNSWGAKCLTFVLGNNNLDPKFRTTIEQIQQNGLNLGNVGLIGEIALENHLLYIGNLYGGNSFESKRRTNYIGIGSYQPIEEDVNTIISPGDTFISEFKFTKLVKTDTEIYSNTVAQFTEIVSFNVETSVDLKNRNDESFLDWDNRFQPRYDDYHKYNRVYSQQGSLILKRDLEFNFKRINDFDTNIIATKLKSPGEIIDSWTDLLPNEVLPLDGKYGPITGLANFKDELFAFQENALTYLSINPRVQVQGSDGISVELGYGSVLQEYKYIDTNSGTKDKWSILTSPNGLYYFDNYNKALKLFKGQNEKLSTIKGLKAYFENNSNFNLIVPGTGIVKKRISTGYDYLNDEAIFTFVLNQNPFTLTYNENTQSFISFYDYKPSFWISRGNNLITTSPNNRAVYKQFAGQYNNFFGTYYPSYVTLMVNPETDLDCVFDNLMYKSEMYLNNVDQPDKTLTHIQAYSEYQNSGLVPLEFGRDKNLRRKFRNWTALIPRENRNRIRNPWIFLKLQLENEENYKMILHDPVVFYTT